MGHTDLTSLPHTPTLIFACDLKLIQRRHDLRLGFRGRVEGARLGSLFEKFLKVYLHPFALLVFLGNS